MNHVNDMLKNGKGMTMSDRVWGLLLLAVVAVHSTAFAGDPTELQGLIATALESNADLKAAEARWTMYANKVVPSQALSDPRLSLGLSSYPVHSLASDESPMTGNDVRIDQAFPFPGKLALKGEAAEQQAAWYKALYLDQRAELVRQVRDTWHRLVYLDQAIGLTQANLEAIDQLARLSETRYSVGRGMQQDVLRAQLQRSRVMDRQLSLKQERDAETARLRALLNRDESLPQRTEAGDLLPELPDVDHAIDGVETSRPLLAAYRAMIDQYRAQRSLAKRDYYPDFGLWAGYRFRDDQLPDGGEDFVSAGISLNLPIFLAKRKAAVADAEAGVTMATQLYRDQYQRVVAALQENRARLEQSRNQALLFRTGIIPQAQQTYDAGLSAYQVGKFSFTEVMESLSSLYAFQIDYQRALSDYRRALARFKQLSGSEPAIYQVDASASTDRNQP